MPENVNNRTTGEKILIWSLIIFGVVALLVGSYAIVKSTKVSQCSTTAAVSAQDIEIITKIVASKLDSLNNTINKNDSIQFETLSNVKSSINKVNRELDQINNRLRRIVNKSK